MKLSAEWKFGLLFAVLALLLIIFRFQEQMTLKPGSVISQWGDGYKAYTVIQYHVKNDSTYSHFEGMNYPYGEHVIPGACQPTLSNLLKLVNDYLFEIPTWTIIPIIHYSIFLSYLLCLLFLYLILRKLKLPVWYSMIVALGLGFMNPQGIRLVSHYGLSHPEVLPITLYLLLLYDERPGWKVSLWMMVAVFIYSGIHFYYFAIMAFTVAFYFLFRFLSEWDWKKVPLYAGHFGVMLIIPFAFFQLWLHDPEITDRTAQPWGFFAYRTFWEGLVTNPYLPLYQWVDQKIINIRDLNVENVSYVGLIGGLVFLGLLFRWIFSAFRKPFVRQDVPKKSWLNHLVYAALVILIFSFGVPFTFSGWDIYLDYTGPVQQFRSIGRFAWVFYYVVNLVVFTLLYQWAFAKSNTTRKIILGFALVVLLVEAYQTAYQKDYEIKEIKTVRTGNSIRDQIGLDFDQFQATLPVPYYNIGSDAFWLTIQGYTAQHSLTLGVQENLPTTAAMLTRTSAGQITKQLQLVSEPYRAPQVLDDYPNTKPLLLMWDLELNSDYLHQKFGHLLEGATVLGEYGEDFDHVRFYSLPLTSFNYRIVKRKRDIQASMERDSNLTKVGAFLSSDSLETFVYKSFDEQNGEKVYLGEGAFKGVMKDKNVLYAGPIPNQQIRPYHVAFWMYIQKDRYTRAELLIREIDPNTGAEIQKWQGGVHRHLWTFDINGWAMFEHVFTPQSADSHIEVSISKRVLGDRPLWVDELLIYPTESMIYKETPEYIWKNNRHFPKGE